MTKLDESTVEIELGGESHQLVVNAAALLKCSAFQGGIIQIYSNVRLMNVQSMLFVLRTGLNDSKSTDEQLIEKIWHSGGLSKIQPKLEEYINLLQSGGLTRNQEETPSEGKP